MTNDTIASPSPVRQLANTEELMLTREISKVLEGVHEAASLFEGIGDLAFDATEEAQTGATAHELRLAAFRLRGAALQCARLLSELDVAAGRLQSLAWAKDTFGEESDDEGRTDAEEVES